MCTCGVVRQLQRVESQLERLHTRTETIHRFCALVALLCWLQKQAIKNNSFLFYTECQSLHSKSNHDCVLVYVIRLRKEWETGNTLIVHILGRVRAESGNPSSGGGWVYVFMKTKRPVLALYYAVSQTVMYNHHQGVSDSLFGGFGRRAPHTSCRELFMIRTVCMLLCCHHGMMVI